MLLHYHHQLICLSTEDITPPVLTFINAPSRSGGDFQITWTANENVTAQCTVQTPSLLFGQPCNWSWTGSNLTEGFYSIYVQLTDLAGNSAPPARHSWFVGMSRVETRVIKTTEMEVKAWIGCWNDFCSVNGTGGKLGGASQTFMIGRYVETINFSIEMETNTWWGYWNDNSYGSQAIWSKEVRLSSFEKSNYVWNQWSNFVIERWCLREYAVFSMWLTRRRKKDIESSIRNSWSMHRLKIQFLLSFCCFFFISFFRPHTTYRYHNFKARYC